MSAFKDTGSDYAIFGSFSRKTSNSRFFFALTNLTIMTVMTVMKIAEDMITGRRDVNR